MVSTQHKWRLAVASFLVLTACGDRTLSESSDSSEAKTSSTPQTTLTTLRPEATQTEPGNALGVFASEEGLFLVDEPAAGPGTQLWDRPTAVAFLVGDTVVAREATDSSDGAIFVFGADPYEIAPIGNEHLGLFDVGVVGGREVAVLTSKTGDDMEDTDVSLLLHDLTTQERSDLGSVGGWENSVGQARLVGDSIVMLTTSEASMYVRVLSLTGEERWSELVGIGLNLSIAVANNEVTVLQPWFVDGLHPKLTVNRFALEDGTNLGVSELPLKPADGLAIEGGFCFTAEWWGDSLVCDQTYGGPLQIAPSGEVGYFGRLDRGVFTFRRREMPAPSAAVLACPDLDSAREPSDVPGPFFVCSGVAGFGGQVFVRDGVTTAEEGIAAWLEGPSEDEQAAGYEGWDLTPYEVLTESITLRREEATLYMDIGQWESVGNLSTSHGSGVFFLSLFGTVFSDPTVEEFVLSVGDESCPVHILESSFCFPITWNDVVNGYHPDGRVLLESRPGVVNNSVGGGT